MRKRHGTVELFDSVSRETRKNHGWNTWREQEIAPIKVIFAQNLRAAILIELDDAQ